MLLNVITVWDLRSFKKPLHMRSDMTTLYPNTNAVFSPDDKYIVTGAGAREKGGHGRLMFLSKSTLEPVKELLVDSTPASCIQIGLFHYFQERGPIDLVISGPNYGRNTTAVFALSSGTLGGALEAAVCGKRAIAVSYAFFDRKDKYLDNDSVFAVKDSLVVKFEPRKGDEKADLELKYDILLAPTE